MGNVDTRRNRSPVKEDRSADIASADVAIATATRGGWEKNAANPPQAAMSNGLPFTMSWIQAEKLADDLSKRFPEDTSVQFNYVPAIHAALALSRGNASKGHRGFQLTTPYELGEVGFPMSLFPVYGRGEAYLAARQGGAAAAEFQKILDHRGVVLNELIGALACLGLARACAIKGDTVKARAAYQDYLALWKDTDSGIPILNKPRWNTRTCSTPKRKDSATIVFAEELKADT